MKRFTVIVFVGFLIWSYVGFFAYFEYEKSEIRREVKLRLKKSVPQSDLIHFVFTKEESEKLVWLEKNEFRHQGKMYDIIRFKTLKNNQLEIFCISDRQESNLFAKLDYFVHRDLHDNPSAPLKSLKILQQQPFDMPDFNNSISIFLEDNRKEQFQSYARTILKGFGRDFLQPPEIA